MLLLARVGGQEGFESECDADSNALSSNATRSATIGKQNSRGTARKDGATRTTRREQRRDCGDEQMAAREREEVEEVASAGVSRGCATNRGEESSSLGSPAGANTPQAEGR